MAQTKVLRGSCQDQKIPDSFPLLWGRGPLAGLAVVPILGIHTRTEVLRGDAWHPAPVEAEGSEASVAWSFWKFSDVFLLVELWHWPDPSNTQRCQVSTTMGPTTRKHTFHQLSLSIWCLFCSLGLYEYLCGSQTALRVSTPTRSPATKIQRTARILAVAQSLSNEMALFLGASGSQRLKPSSLQFLLARRRMNTYETFGFGIVDLNLIPATLG